MIHGQRKRVLLVDDEEGFTRLTRLSLERSGRYEVTCINDPREALAAARHLQPHVVLLDMVMPDLDGEAVARQIEADDTLRGTPIAILTATMDKGEHNAEIIRTEDGRVCVPKPARLETLTRVIDEMTRREFAALGE